MRDGAWMEPQRAVPVTQRLVTVCAQDVVAEPIRWLWPGRIALGKLTLIAGDPGLGKSMLTACMAAHVTRATSGVSSGGRERPVRHRCPSRVMARMMRMETGRSRHSRTERDELKAAKSPGDASL